MGELLLLLLLLFAACCFWLSCVEWFAWHFNCCCCCCHCCCCYCSCCCDDRQVCLMEALKDVMQICYESSSSSSSRDLGLKLSVETSEMVVRVRHDVF